MNSQGENDYIKKEEEAKRRQILRKRQIARNQRGIIGTPPMRGRKHETIQTDRYLEEVKNTKKKINEK
jgi:radial spoke head protein 3